MADEPIYRTIFTVEVFSRGPYRGGEDDPRHTDLQAIDYDISIGDCIGMITETKSEVVPQAEVVDHLLRIHNDGSFFDEVD